MSKIKKKHILSVILLAILALTAIHFIFKPLNSSVTIDGLQAAAEQTDHILIKSYDKYFEIQGTNEFSALFEFEKWQYKKKEPTEQPVLILRFAEAWIVEFFSDGTVTAYNGYASSGTKKDAYYVIPSNVTDELIDYIKMHGRELVDKTINTTTFHK